MPKNRGRSMILEVLGEGRANAKTGRELADIFGCDIRDITRQIRRERLKGARICATSKKGTGTPCGYFIGTEEETQAYCNRLLHRGRELFGVRGALLKTLPAADKEKGGKHGKG